MHHHRNDRPAAVARPGTQAHENQRRLVLELTVEPPPDGDRPADLARALELSTDALEAAAEVLIAAGLAERRGGRLFASAATRALDVLWPLAM